jgi:glutathione S-transferase
MMRLYDNPASPFCRKVRVVLHETGQTDDVTIEYAVGHPLDPEKMPLAENPLGKIPALVRAEGPTIYDSRVICRYLDDRAQGGLYPENRLWDVLTLEATADGIMDAAVLMIYEGRSRPEDMRYQPWVDAQWDKITRTLDAVGARWMAHLSGGFDMGHIAMACALGYLDFRHGDRDWRHGRPMLAGWFDTVSERASIAATVPHT